MPADLARLGTVTDMIDPAALNLPAGSHQVQLSSLLIIQTGTFRTDNPV